jgi:hypothetical protein
MNLETLPALLAQVLVQKQAFFTQRIAIAGGNSLRTQMAAGQL